MELQIIDIARADIDTALKQGKHETALLTAQKLFPQRRLLLQGAMMSGDVSQFRELCGIQQGAERVGGEFIPGPYHQPVAPVAAQVAPYKFDTAQAIEYTKPVLFVGALAGVGALVVTAIGAIMAGLQAAFVVIGQVVGYVAGAVVVLFILRYAFSVSRTQQDTTQNSGGGIYVTNNFNINGQSGTNSIQ